MKLSLILTSILTLSSLFIGSQDAEVISKLIDELNTKVSEMPLAEGNDAKIKYAFKFDEQTNQLTVFASNYSRDGSTRQGQRTIYDFNLSDIDLSSITYKMSETSNRVSIKCNTVDNKLLIRERNVLAGEIISTIQKNDFSLGKWRLDEDWDEVREINSLYSEAVFVAHYGNIDKNTEISSSQTLIIMDTIGNWRNDADTPEDEEVFVVVEQMPEYPGGRDALAKYIKNNLRHPDEKKKKKRHGKVFVNFIIEKNGSISNPILLKSMGIKFDEEAIRLITEMPNWKPGVQRGKNTRVSYNLPIEF